jgi:hypothetical protein
VSTPRTIIDDDEGTNYPTSQTIVAVVVVVGNLALDRRTYRWFTGSPLYQFGEGLSYHTLSYSGLRVQLAPGAEVAAEQQEQEGEEEGSIIPSSAIDAVLGGAGVRRLTRFNAPVLATLEVTVHCAEGERMKALRGARRGGEEGVGGGWARDDTSLDCPHSALLFASAPGAGAAGRPLKTLAGFARTAGRSAMETVRFNLTALDLSVVHPGGNRSAVAGAWNLTVGVGANAATTTVNVAP